MSDPARLRDSGDPADRELLRAAAPAIPAGTQERVRQAIERRLDVRSPSLLWPRPRPRLRLGHVLMALLLGGSAVAVGASGLRSWLRPVAPEPAPAVDPPQPRPAPTPRRPRPAPRTAKAALPARPAEAPPVVAAPVAAPPPPSTAPSPPAPAPETLHIARQDRKAMTLRVAGGRIEGFARGLEVRLAVAERELTGTIGQASVQLWLRGRRLGDDLIEGTIDGRESGFYLRPTDRGQLLQGAIPGHSVRLELGPDVLSFYPGCDGELRATGPGTYQGTCSGRSTRVALPPAFSRMPRAQQLIVLALLLTETDPVLKYAHPRLFPSE